MLPFHYHENLFFVFHTTSFLHDFNNKRTRQILQLIHDHSVSAHRTNGTAGVMNISEFNDMTIGELHIFHWPDEIWNYLHMNIK